MILFIHPFLFKEWEFIQGLSYTSQAPQDAAFIQLIYTTRLRKYTHAAEHALTRQRLVEEFGLPDNPDVLFSFADALYTDFRWADCFAITSRQGYSIRLKLIMGYSLSADRIVSLVSIHGPTMPLHIACMYHLSHLHSKLFVLAHDMVDREPENPVSWYAVGVWYLSRRKWSQARQYFRFVSYLMNTNLAHATKCSKTSLMDPRFGPAWIAFAHTFALEGEHEHAITAYSTCSRMFTGQVFFFKKE